MQGAIGPVPPPTTTRPPALVAPPAMPPPSRLPPPVSQGNWGTLQKAQCKGGAEWGDTLTHLTERIVAGFKVREGTGVRVRDGGAGAGGGAAAGRRASPRTPW